MDRNELKDTMQQLDRTVMSLDLRSLPLGLFDGKMGVCIYFFYLARLQNNQHYRYFAEKMLEHVFDLTKDISTIQFHTGVSGVAWGIQHLVNNKFVTGNLDYILREADDLMFRCIHFDLLDSANEIDRVEFLWLLIYYADRLQTVKDKTERILMRKTVIKMLNHMEDCYSDTFRECPVLFNIEKNELPLYLLILSKLYKLDFYNDKIVKIWDGLSNDVLSSMPSLHVNRLSLLVGIQKVLECVALPQWETHAKLLKANINHQKIIEQEFLNKNITLGRGVSGYCLLLFILAESNVLSEFKNSILTKIELSDIWRGRFAPSSNAIAGNIGLANGYTGTALMYNILLNS